MITKSVDPTANAQGMGSVIQEGVNASMDFLESTVIRIAKIAKMVSVIKVSVIVSMDIMVLSVKILT